MRRFVLLLLIAVLPLQSIWAAAADGCLPGDAAAGGHFGHHEHGVGHDHAVLTGAADDGGAGHASGTAGGGEDCSPAHGHCCLGILASGGAALSHPGDSAYLAAYLRVVPDAFLENPLRPPRSALV
jgi:hypothetical protein